MQAAKTTLTIIRFSTRSFSVKGEKDQEKDTNCTKTKRKKKQKNQNLQMNLIRIRGVKYCIVCINIERKNELHAIVVLTMCAVCATFMLTLIVCKPSCCCWRTSKYVLASDCGADCRVVISICNGVLNPCREHSVHLVSVVCCCYFISKQSERIE